jgi:serine/threonine-protein kinase RsbW
VSLVNGAQEPDETPLRPHEVEVRMLARGDQVPGIRALAADMAMHEDFDLDAISDLRLAVEEACATVLANADPDSVLVCRLLVTGAALDITAFVTVADGLDPSVGPLSLRILRTLSDSVDYWTTKFGNRRRFHVQLTRALDQSPQEA